VVCVCEFMKYESGARRAVLRTEDEIQCSSLKRSTERGLKFPESETKIDNSLC
jgi:hypothetical protein